jgi:hypothetical protein
MFRHPGWKNPGWLVAIASLDGLQKKNLIPNSNLRGVSVTVGL